MAYIGQEIPKLGFGLMRLPMIGEDVDIEQTKQMVDLFLEKGFTYFDTAYGYLGGKSEQAARVALVERYPRERFQLATKLPAFDAKTAEEARGMLQTSLQRTGAGYFDFYLLHSLGDERTQMYEDFHLWEFAAEQKAKGLIKHLGFSFHDKADALEALLTRHPEAEFVQLQINYIDWESDSVESRKCYEVARAHGKPVIIMEPVKGGSLTALPKNAEELLKRAAPDASLASWAVRYAASLEGLVTVLSGMSSLQQMQDNVSFMEHFKPLSAEEQALIAEARRLINEVPRIPCTACRYCVPGCPAGVLIPEIFQTMNNYKAMPFLEGSRGHYEWLTRDGGKASGCVECGHCETVCPQHIQIVKELQDVVKTFEG